MPDDNQASARDSENIQYTLGFNQDPDRPEAPGIEVKEVNSDEDEQSEQNESDE